MVWTDCYCPIETEAFTAPLLRLRLLIFARLRLIPFRTGHGALKRKMVWMILVSIQLSPFMSSLNPCSSVTRCVRFSIVSYSAFIQWFRWLHHDMTTTTATTITVATATYAIKYSREIERERMRQKYFVCVPCDCCAAPIQIMSNDSVSVVNFRHEMNAYDAMAKPDGRKRLL